MSRRRPGPRAGTNVLHLIGDTHFGALTTAPYTSRYARVKADLDRLPPPEFHLQLGDLTENGGITNTEIVTALAWHNSLNAPRLNVVGNHCMYKTGVGVGSPPWPFRSADEAAADMGLPAANYVREVANGDADLIVLGPDALDTTNVTGCRYDTPALTFLDQALDASTKDVCLIAAHAPLKNTVGFGDSSPYRSSDQFFHAASDAGFTTDAGIRAVLADHPKAKAWISGHTHSVLGSNRLVYGETVGGHTLVNINTSCIAYTGNVREWTDRLVTMRLQIEDDRLDVHFRDHGARQWVGGGPQLFKPWSVSLAT